MVGEVGWAQFLQAVAFFGLYYWLKLDQLVDPPHPQKTLLNTSKVNCEVGGGCFSTWIFRVLEATESVFSSDHFSTWLFWLTN